jgi:outer membrane lipoprotein-sorting protein
MEVEVSNARFLAIMAVIALFAPKFALAQQAQVQELDAPAILKRMVQSYRTLATYSDRGVSISHLGTGDRAFDERLDFATSFKRPGKFRFAWTSQVPYIKEEHTNVIWSDGITSWSLYFYNDGVAKREKSLSMAIAGATGVSHGSALDISNLLMDDIGGLQLDMLKNYRIVGNENVDDVDCVILSGYYKDGTEQQIWVDKKDYVVRRIVEIEKGVTTREATLHDIKLNMELSDSSFTQDGG